MGKKKRINTFYEMRNGMPVKSLGDKIYKAPDYKPGFFKEGGLIVGSTYFNFNLISLDIKRNSQMLVMLRQ